MIITQINCCETRDGYRVACEAKMAGMGTIVCDVTFDS